MSEQAPWRRRGLEAGTRQNLRHGALHRGRVYCVLYMYYIYTYVRRKYSVLRTASDLASAHSETHGLCFLRPRLQPNRQTALWRRDAPHRTAPHRTAPGGAPHRCRPGPSAPRQAPPCWSSDSSEPNDWLPLVVATPPTPQTEVCPRRLLIGRGSWHLAACCSPLPAGGVQLCTLWGLEPPRAWIVWRMGLPWHPGHTGHPWAP